MRLSVRRASLTHPEPIVILNTDDCLEMGVSVTDRVIISNGKAMALSVAVSEAPWSKGVVSMGSHTMEVLSVSEGDTVDVRYSPPPESIVSIRRKIDGFRLDPSELKSVVDDIAAGAITQKEILSFVSAFTSVNSDLHEVAELARAMASTGRTVDLGIHPVFDFHSLGGVPGNSITPVVVSIVASEGLKIPKMSSRAVSSACGTADYVSVFSDVEMDADDLERAVSSVGGVFICGNEDFAPVGKSIIDAERPLGIDPRPTMMASIMSKKIAIGTTHLLVDIPVGPGTKVADEDAAESIADDLIDLGTILGMHVECVTTRGSQPVCGAIGPVLEARACIRMLENDSTDRFAVSKACELAGILLEMAGIREGSVRAREVLESGAAHEKFLEIVALQHGDPHIRSGDLVPGSFIKDVHASRSGVLARIDNPGLVAVAKAAGAPSDVGAGLEIFRRAGDRVGKGDTLFRIYAESRAKLDRAVESARSRRPMAVSDTASDILSDMDPVIVRHPSKAMLDMIRYRIRRSHSLILSIRSVFLPFMDFLELARRRYSVRRFSDRSLPEEAVQHILEAGRLAPTAKNNQPQRVYVVRSEEGLKKIDDLTPCRYGAPVVLVVAYDASEEWCNPFEDGIRSGQQDASIVATHMMLEAQDLGIGSLWINYFPNSKAASVFGLPPNEKIVLLMAFGYPSDDAAPSPSHGSRKELSETVRFI